MGKEYLRAKKYTEQIAENIEANIQSIQGDVSELQNTGVDTTARSTKVDKGTNHFYVGAGHEFSTIAAALAAWSTAGNPDAVFHIAQGLYNEHNNIPSTAAKIAFIGECRETTIVKDSSGVYANAPFSCHNGNVIFENLTLIADHSGNPSFDYTGHEDKLNAYALHTDSGTNPGNFVVRNCTLISYQDAALGCGTIEGQEISVEDSALFSYTDTVAAFPNASVSLTHGGLLYHTKSVVETTFEKLKLKNVTVYSKNSPHVFYHQSFSDAGIMHDLECVNVSLAGDVASGSAMFYPTSRSVSFPTPWYVLDKKSFGNNVLALNYVNLDATVDVLTETQKFLGITTSGFALSAASVDAIMKCGYYVTGTTDNTPTAAAYLVFHIGSSANYAHQTAWKLTDGTKYQRHKSGGTWGSWVAG